MAMPVTIAIAVAVAKVIAIAIAIARASTVRVQNRRLGGEPNREIVSCRVVCA